MLDTLVCTSSSVSAAERRESKTHTFPNWQPAARLRSYRTERQDVSAPQICHSEKYDDPRYTDERRQYAMRLARSSTVLIFFRHSACSRTLRQPQYGLFAVETVVPGAQLARAARQTSSSREPHSIPGNREAPREDFGPCKATHSRASIQRTRLTDWRSPRLHASPVDVKADCQVNTHSRQTRE